jgi:hypothetical protein
VDWATVEASFRDELAKIAEVSLAGLSPKTLLAQKPAPPFETPGLTRAMSILDRYEQQTKTAAPRIPFTGDLPQVNRVVGRKKRKTEGEGVVEQGKSLGGHLIGGMGIGRLAGEFAHGPHPRMSPARIHSNKWWATAAGGGIGAAEFARKRLAEHFRARMEAKGQKKTAAMMPTPGLRLMASQKVGKKVTNRALRSGPTLGSVTRKSHVAGTKQFGVL